MTDDTSEVAELSAAYLANRTSNATITAEVRAKYRAIMAEEIRQRKQESDAKFAQTLARVKAESGIPVSVVQEHVLHTKAWDKWVYWRDLAGIPTERVVRDSAKAEPVSQDRYEWGEPFTPEGYDSDVIFRTLIWQTHPDGTELERPVVFDQFVMAFGKPLAGFSDPEADAYAREVFAPVPPGSYVLSVVQEAVENGTLVLP